MLRRSMILAPVGIVFVLLGLVASGPAADQDARGDGWVPLFNGKDFTGWRKFLDPRKHADPDRIWTVQDGMIHCEGSVYGYLITEKDYGDFELKVQWRWGDKTTKGQARNSGVFVWVSGPDKIWPKAVEAQLLTGRAGDIWLVDGFKLHVDPSLRDPRNPRHYLHMKDNVEKPIGAWNQYDITCKGDTLRLVVNGVLENEGTGAEATEGKILLQSEGAEVFFRDIKLRSLR